MSTRDDLQHIRSALNGVIHGRGEVIDTLLIGLLVAGYLSGYVKLRYSSWLGYVLPDGLCVLLLVQTVFGRRDRTLPLPRSGLTVAVLLLTGYCAVEILNPAAPLAKSRIRRQSRVCSQTPVARALCALSERRSSVIFFSSARRFWV